LISVVSWIARLAGGEVIPSPVALPPGVELRPCRWITTVAGRTSGMDGPAAAVALGRTILVRPGTPVSPRLLRHELAHVRQWERWPLTFPFRYIAAHILHGYGANPYEAEARAAESGRNPSGDGA
jgi:hypothetical protein